MVIVEHSRKPEITFRSPDGGRLEPPDFPQRRASRALLGCTGRSIDAVVLALPETLC
jgi:hypothetical protein